MTERTFIEEDTGVSEQEMADFLGKEARRLGISLEVSEPPLENLYNIGSGSTGTVTAAMDAVLGRAVAVKNLHKNLRMESDELERMIREAQAAAQLEHPNIVPIYSLGLSPTRGVYFTMKRLRGDSLRHIITQLSLKNPAYTWEYTMARRLSIFIRICQGISYAHSKGILHRDLKPENIRVGNFGEVTIIDWGLVREVGEGKKFHLHIPHDVSTRTRREKFKPVETQYENLIDASNPTMDGELSGTPRYMSPEQADAHNSELDIRSDIYSLGVILFELLTCFNPFYDKHGNDEILQAVIGGKFPKPRQFANAVNIPGELEAICLKAMSHNRDKRYQTVDELLRDVYAHQDGRNVAAYNASPMERMRKLFQRHPIKSALSIGAICMLLTFAAVLFCIEYKNYASLFHQAENYYQTAIVQKNVLQERIISNGLEYIQETSGYLGVVNEIDNNLEEANLLLESISPLSQWKNRIKELREKIIIAELDSATITQRYNVLNKRLEQICGESHQAMLKNSSRLRQAVEIGYRNVRGDGMITLLDTPDEAVSVRICPISVDAETQHYVVDEPMSLPGDFAMVPIPEDAEGNAQSLEYYLPMSDVILPKGQYMLLFRAPDRQEVKMHVNIRHGEKCSLLVRIPENVPRDFVYIPAGNAIVSDNIGQGEHNVFVDSFFIGKYEVTFGQYKEFWLTLDQTNRQLRVPKIQFLIYEYKKPIWDNEGNWLVENFNDEMAAVGLTNADATAFCKWYGEKTGCECRLPTVNEWEKAARGVAAWKYPWGEFFDESACLIRDNVTATPKYALTAPPGQFPADESPYGVFDMAGNAREWTSSKFNDRTLFWQIKGASAVTSSRFLPLYAADDVPLVPTDVGFRIVLPCPE